MEALITGVAQLGPIAKADNRKQVVARMTALLHEAAARGCRFVVFPELALTTFFPRWVYDRGDAELEAFFEDTMPGPETRADAALASNFDRLVAQGPQFGMIR